MNMAGTLFGIPQNMIAGAGSQPNWGNWAQGPGQVPGNQQGGMATTQPVQNMPAQQYPGGGQMNPSINQQSPNMLGSSNGQYPNMLGSSGGMQSIMQMLMQHPAIQSMIQQHMQGMGQGQGMGGGQMNPSINQQYPGGGQMNPSINQSMPQGGWQQLPSPNTLGAAAQNPMQGYTGGGTGNLFGIPSNMIQR